MTAKKLEINDLLILRNKLCDRTMLFGDTTELDFFTL